MNAFDRAFIKAYTHDLEPSCQADGQESGSAGAALGSGHLPTIAQDDALATDQIHRFEEAEPVEPAAPPTESAGLTGRVPAPHLQLLNEHPPILAPAELAADSAIQAELAPAPSEAELKPPTQTIRLENRESPIPPRPHFQ
ncbi:MAG: hypothetical protein IH914_00520, partial [candidate division Zixibacteria bacterium]|nr:hypothetical protein [candidate division Zixibacteria bacterium]